VLPALAVALAVCVYAPDHRAPDEVHLRDGRVLVGAVVGSGERVAIHTRAGVIEVAAAEITSRRSEDELRAEVERLAAARGDDALGHLELARLARDYGLTAELWHHVERCLAAVESDPASPIAPRLSELLATLAPELLPERDRDAAPDRFARALLRQARTGVGAGKRAAIVEVLVRAEGSDRALEEAARTALAPQRTLALEALQRRAAGRHVALVAQRSVADPDAGVRETAARLVRDHGSPAAAVRQLAYGLLDAAPRLRIDTAAALGDIGGPEAAAVLVLAGPLAGVAAQSGGAGGVRSNMSVTTSRAYIRDFNVEIAQAAAIAKPVVGSLRTGVALDVTVAAVVTERVQIESAYRNALRKIAGSDPGPDPQTWRQWLAAHDPAAAALLPDR
jgi:hypothetical protein